MAISKTRRFEPSPTFEAIAVQSGSFFNDVVGIFEEFKKSGYSKENSNVLQKLDKYVFEHTGLLVETKFVEDSLEFAAEMPLLTAKSVLLNIPAKVSSVGPRYLQQARETMSGVVDINKCKVGGVYSRIKTTVLIDPIFLFGAGREDVVLHGFDDKGNAKYKTLVLEEMYKGGWSLTPSETAAVYVHELGHIFTYFETLVESVSTNQVLNEVSRRVLECTTPAERVGILTGVERDLNFTIQDKAALATTEDPASIFNVLMTSKIDQQRSAVGSSVYDIKSWEAMADQFAVRHGAGRELVTAANKIGTEYSGIVNVTKTEVVMSGLFILLMNVAFTAIVPVLGIITTIITLQWDSRLNTDKHDLPIDRFNRIKHDIVNQLKNQKLNPVVKEKLLLDIKVIDSVLETLSMHRTFMAVVWDYIRPAKRDARKQYLFQQELEKLASNSLFTQAAKLSTLS